MIRSILVFAALLLLAACGPEEEELPATYTNVKAQVFAKSCNNFQGCHRGASPAGALDLTDPAAMDLMRPSIADPARMLIVAGDPGSSFMMDKMLDRNVPAPGTEMPPGALIEADRIALVERWIAAGAMND